MAESKYGIAKFNGKNYQAWKMRLLMVFKVEDVEMAMDPTHVAARGYKSKNNRCLQLIMQSLHDNHLTYMKNTTHAYKVIQKLDAVYSCRDQEAIQHLKQKWQQLKLRSGQDMFKHINAFDQIVADLEDAGCELSDHEILTQLLMSMPSEYRFVVKFLQRQANVTVELAKQDLINEYHSLC